MSKTWHADKLVQAPWKVNISLTEGCNISALCPFCGINAIRQRSGDFKFLDIRDAEIIAEQLATFASRSKIKFEGRGEPLVNRQYLQIFKIFRHHLPNTQFTLLTNGIALSRDPNKFVSKLEEIFEFVDLVHLDIYYGQEYLIDIVQHIEEKTDIPVHNVYDFPKGQSPYANHRRKIQRTLYWMEDIVAYAPQKNSKTKNLHNAAGNAKSIPATTEPLDKVCDLPFRELNVSVEGTVHVCCLDWQNQLVLGDIDTSTLEDIWYGEDYRAVRRMLYERNRGFSPCYTCNRKPSRAGLLPKYAKQNEDGTWPQVATVEDISLTLMNLDYSAANDRNQTANMPTRESKIHQSFMNRVNLKTKKYKDGERVI